MKTKMSEPKNSVSRVDHQPLVAPLSLWLQWHGDGSPDDDGHVAESDVTWCREKVFEHDVEYVRADRVNILLQALHGLTMPCTRADYTVAKLDAVVCEIAEAALDEFRLEQIDQQRKAFAGSGVRQIDIAPRC
jgi:hypothetical protein